MKPKIDYCFKELMKNSIVRKGFIGAIFDIDPEEIAEFNDVPLKYVLKVQKSLEEDV